MNFVIDLPSSKRDKVVYNLIFIIVDRCTKMIKYLSIIIKIDVAKLTNIFFKKIVLHFDISTNIVNDKSFYLLIFFDQRFVIMQKSNVDLTLFFILKQMNRRKNKIRF